MSVTDTGAESISYAVNFGTDSTLKRWVTNSTGHIVRSLTSSAGVDATGTWKWSLRNSSGNRVKPGTYHMHIRSTSAVQHSNTLTKKVTVR